MHPGLLFVGAVAVIAAFGRKKRPESESQNGLAKVSLHRSGDGRSHGGGVPDRSGGKAGDGEQLVSEPGVPVVAKAETKIEPKTEAAKVEVADTAKVEVKQP